MKISPETVNKLQSDASCIRNICILAHVDHGKTSLSDSLLATNGIISQRMAGKVRYLDSREDEQLRGITMEASAISLYFKTMKVQKDEEKAVIKEHLINLIDSPGHIDFSSEVSTSSRLCDGAIVLVDAVEGVCSQTVNVLRQCWIDKLKPILVINKIDRLITEWKLTPLEAYQHISRVIEQVNSVIGSFFAGDRLEDDLIWREGGEIGEFIEKDDENLYFMPEKNNVIFASAIDGWAFSINTFAKIYSKKLGFSQQALLKTLWGDFYLDIKNKKILPGKKLKNGNSKPLFVSLILDQIWAIYENCIIDRNQDKLEKIIEKLGAKISPRDLRSKDFKNLLNQIMSQWIPLSHAILGAVIDYLPSPIVAQSERIDKILNETIYSVVKSEQDKSKLIDPSFVKAMQDCDSSNADTHTMAYVSKLISVPNEELPTETALGSEISAEELKERARIARELAKKASEAAAKAQESKANEDEFVIKPKKDPFEWEFEEEDFEEEQEDEEPEETEFETLVGFTRIYSGTLSKGQKLTIVGPKYDPSLPRDHEKNINQISNEIEIKDLFLIMGREFVKMEKVPAGNICGVVGLDQVVLKNATICSPIAEDKPYVNLASTSTLIHNKPIMKIAVEPTNPMKLAKLERGLDLLAKADPVLEWYIDDESGELIVCVAGELHLERCLKDLEERFARGCEVTVKEPVIPFRESLADDKINQDMLAVIEESDEEEDVDILDLDVDVRPLPTEITKFLVDNDLVINEIVKNNDEEVKKEFIEKFQTVISEEKQFFGFADAKELIDNIVAFGPKRVGPNLLIDKTNKLKHIFSKSQSVEKFEYENNILNGTQLALNEGPLASEPLHGIAIIIKKIDKNDLGEDKLISPGKIITQTKNLIHKQFLIKSPRLLLAMYTCEIQAASDVLGKVYAVVQKREGSIISEEMKEGTPFFTIVARLPVIQAFGFSEDIRKKTSGAASPQLIFDGFDILDIDPFWVPHTEEELEELGEFAERENVARRYMNNIRRRKGLFIDEKVVNKAEKQRTLKKD
ncbi:RIA1 [Candida pseudojiufengensis]|uniref:RIA1 n=1 Tax=Candida pseudojiufengensis TaxID=497109 RepID=UPI0022250DF0|nr:RIA1 [Candida pseudojiufengensis]KAI5964566.1 RIA1 [Candida pseudojiufengensis]